MDSVVIKSNPHGITLLLDDQIEFEPLIRQICRKFANAKEFFGKVDMALEIKMRKVTDEEAAVIIDAIELNSDIRITLFINRDKVEEAKRKRQIDKFHYEKEFNHAKIIRGSVGRNQKVSSDCGLIVLGDVKENAVVTAKSNLFVFGSLAGDAVAGADGNNRCFIVANEIKSPSVQIGNCKGSIVYQNKWLHRTMGKGRSPVAVVVWDGCLLAEPLGSGLLKQI